MANFIIRGCSHMMSATKEEKGGFWFLTWILPSGLAFDCWLYFVWTIVSFLLKYIFKCTIGKSQMTKGTEEVGKIWLANKVGWVGKFSLPIWGRGICLPFLVWEGSQKGCLVFYHTLPYKLNDHRDTNRALFKSVKDKFKQSQPKQRSLEALMEN